MLVAGSVLIVCKAMEGLTLLPPDFRHTASGAVALQLAAAQSFCAFFLDIATCDDGSNGYRITRQLRRQGASAPIYLLALSPSPTIEALALASGASAVIPRNIAAVREALAAIASGTFSSRPGAGAAGVNAVRSGATHDLADAAARAKRLLPAYVGPVADLMAEDAMAQLVSRGDSARTPAALYSILASHIADPVMQKRFLDQLADPRETHR